MRLERQLAAGYLYSCAVAGRGGRLPLFHFDMYRLGSSDELFDIGWEDYLARGGVCAVEWSENIADALEEGTISVDIRRGASEDQRILTIEGVEL